MANNTFRSVTAVLTTVNEVMYTAPPAVTTIVINAHVANTSSTPVKVTFSHFTGSSGDERSLVSNFPIQGNDAYLVTLGNLVVNEGDSIKAFTDRDAPARLILSILETGGV
jgi:hypothetical protein